VKSITASASVHIAGAKSMIATRSDTTAGRFVNNAEQ
jgi:hypothetical protein